MNIKSIFNHIYIIHLPQSIEREKHFRDEFKKIGLNVGEYEVFTATYRTSDRVKKLMMSAKVKKFPPCFRCGQNRCHCENNILTYSQIANWYSFRSVWHDIMQHKYPLCMICEDDVVFHPTFVSSVIKLLSSEHLKIDLKKPVLFLLNTTNPAHTNHSCSPKLSSSEGSMSNACYALNLPMARLLFTESCKNNGINHTSDVFTHSRMPRMHSRLIQRRIILPIPSSQLSILGHEKSYVRPKGGIRKVKYIPGKSKMFYIKKLK